MTILTCSSCGAVSGELGAYSAKDGRWHRYPDLDSYNSDVGFALWPEGYPDVRLTRVVTHDGKPLCRGCLIRAVRPGRPRTEPAELARRRAIRAGEAERSARAAAGQAEMGL